MRGATPSFCVLRSNALRFALGNAWLALAACALVAFNPQFLFASALVSNDPLLIALAAALLWACVRTLQNRRFPLLLPPALVLGLLLGLALITKQSALLLLPLAPLALLGRPSSPASRLGAVLRDLSLFALTTLLVAGWWYWRNRQLYGDLLGLAVFQAEFRSEAFDWRNPLAWQSGLARLHNSFWAYFGWTSLPAPTWVYLVIAAFELLALAGLLHLAWRWWQQRSKPAAATLPTAAIHGLLHPVLLNALAPLLALAWTISFASAAGLVAWQGRFLFPALAALALAIAAGLLAWGRAVLLSALLALALLAAACPLLLIAPAYPWYTLPEARALAERGTPTYARFGDGDRLGVEIQGWQLAQPLRAGQSAELTLTWHARTRVAKRWSIFVHLIDARGKIAFDSDGQPHGGDFPMTLWTPEDWLRDTRMLQLPATLPPGRYTLRVGLFDQASGKRAPYFNDDDMTNVEGDSFDLATVEVVP